MEKNSNQQHTPGPWGWHRSNVVTVGVGLDDPLTAHNLAQIFGHPEIAEANARLIAAAPELLDTLRYVVEEYDGPDNGRTLRWAIDEAREVIAKATSGGEE